MQRFVIKNKAFAVCCILLTPISCTLGYFFDYGSLLVLINSIWFFFIPCGIEKVNKTPILWLGRQAIVTCIMWLGFYNCMHLFN